MAATIVVVIRVDDDTCRDPQDLANSVTARVAGEAGYLNDGQPIVPTQVRTGVYPLGFEDEIVDDIMSHATATDEVTM